MTIFLSEHDAARLGIAGAKPRRKAKAARDARPDIPRAEPGQGDRIACLMPLAIHGYGPRWDAATGFCFWNTQTGARTTAQQSYAAACTAAEGEVTK